MGETQNKKTTTLVLMGRTGNGKSATANSIVGRKEFFAKLSGKSVTKECKLKSTIWKDGDGRLLNVVDTPGLFDTDADQGFVAKEIVKCIQLAKDGMHGVLLVISVRNRFTDEEAAVLDCLQILFGPKITDYMVVAFTGGDELEGNETTLEEYLEDCPKTLKHLLHRCNNRMVLFNNKTTSQTKKTQQVTELLKQIDSVVAENGGQPYSDELFLKFQAMTRTFVSQPAGSVSPQGNSKEMSQCFTQTIAMVEKRMEIVVAKLQEQLASEQNARRKADNKVMELECEVYKLKNKPLGSEVNKPEKKPCSIL